MKFLLLKISFLFVSAVIAQEKLNPFLRYTDFHIHPTYKNYFRYKTASEMKLFLDSTRYDRINDTMLFSKWVVDSFQNVNWTKYQKTKNKAIETGVASDLRNYDQSGYPEIMYVPGSILCNSYSPYEKQFALERFKRLISHLLVTKMGLPRLNSYSLDDHTPFRDFLAEYYFNLMQQQKRFVVTRSPQSLYKHMGNGFKDSSTYYNIIKMVRDSQELHQIINHNDSVFNAPIIFGRPHEIITPMIMSIEGAQVLYDTLSAKKQYILNPLNNIAGSADSAEQSIQKAIHAELLNIADSLKNLHHRLFFITLGHFAQNHVVGFAKSLDRDPENVQHRAISTITLFPGVKSNILRKAYSGFNYNDSIGFRVVEEFLNPRNTRFNKPTYIDVKHMDVQGRIQYYYLRRKYERDFNTRIPIIASHCAVSGETQATAVATGLWPNFDRYPEIDRIEKFYNRKIFLKHDSLKRSDYWARRVMKGEYIRKKHRRPLDAFERAMYRSLDFLTDTIFNGKPYDPFKGYRPDENKVGWYYPWSINLFDEEIIEINKSDGIIGLLLDPRQLGAYMPKSRHIKEESRSEFSRLKSALDADSLKLFYLSLKDIDSIEYFKSEPLVRNIFYIVNLLQLQQHAEQYYKDSDFDVRKTREKFSWFIPDTLYTVKDPWKIVAIGGDFDGLIDPIDFAPTASYIPLLRSRLIVYAYMYAQIHKEQFKDPVTQQPLINSLLESSERINQVFFQNGKEFILKYF